MAEYLPAWRKTSKLEAGYANNPADKGKETWRGIARSSWPGWEGWPQVDAAKKVLGLADAVLQVSALARKQLNEQLAQDEQLEAMVVAFFEREFWKPLGLDKEPLQAVAEKAFDVCVNMGERPALAAMRGAYERIKAEHLRLGVEKL